MTKPSLESALRRAQSRARQGELGEARAAFEAILARFPANRRARKAMSELRQAGLRAPPPPIRPQERARIAQLQKAHDHAGVVRLLAAILEDHPREAALWNVLGAAYVGLQDAGRAEACFREAIRLNPFNAEAQGNLAATLKAQGRPEEAADRFREALRLDPERVETRVGLGNLLKDQGAFEDAAACFRAALARRPGDAIALYSLGAAEEARGGVEAAEAAFREALAQAPDFAEAHRSLGRLLRRRDAPEGGVRHLQRVAELLPDDPAAHCDLGLALADDGDPEAGLAACRRALACAPDHAPAHLGVGNILAQTGALAAAAESYERAVACQPDCARAYLNLSDLRTFRDDDPLIGRMLALHGSDGLSDPERADIGFALFKALDDCGRCERAYAFLREANALRKAEMGYRPDEDRALFENVRALFAGPAPELDAPAPLRRTPVFILGMPRSGTTLTEQILSGHPQVHGAGELSRLHQLCRPLVEDGAAFDAGALREIRARYAAHLDGLGGGGAFVTDKAPQNFLWIGMIRLALPEAKVIRLQRDPRDVCWSALTRSFVSRNMGYSFDPADAVAYHGLYEELMAFWRRRFEGVALDVRYETLVAEPERETRRILDHVGLPWDPACLEIEKNRRVVKTASRAQVRQGIYRGGSGRWRRYAPFLEGAFDGLAADADELAADAGP